MCRPRHVPIPVPRTRGRERASQPLDEGRHPLLPLGHPLGGKPGPERNLLHQLVVDHSPCQPLGHLPGHDGAAGAELAGDGDQHGLKMKCWGIGR